MGGWALNYRMRASLCSSFMLSVLLFLSSVQAACSVVLLRFKDGVAYRLNKEIIAESCTYPNVIRALHGARYLPGMHQAMYVLADHVLVTDTERPEPMTVVGDEGGVVVLWEPVEDLQAFIPVIIGEAVQGEAPYKRLGPLACQDTRRMVGLPNIRKRTCYANSMLQCLFHLPHFYYRLAIAVKRAGLSEETTLAGSMKAVMDCMAGTGAVEGAKLTRFLQNLGRALMIQALSQQDSAEIITRTLEHLNQALTRNVDGNQILEGTCIFDDLLGIKVLDQRRRGNGELAFEDHRTDFVITVKAPQQVIQRLLEIDPRISTTLEVLRAERATGRQSRAHQQELALLEARFGPPEVLDLDMMLLATTIPEETENSEGVVVETISKCFLQLPPYLFINFSRSGFNYRLGNHVNFPLRDLNLSLLVAGNELGLQGEFFYNLKAIVLHVGAGSTSGHYVAVVLNENDGNWYTIDDAVVTQVQMVDGHFPATICEKATYFLYTRGT